MTINKGKPMTTKDTEKTTEKTTKRPRHKKVKTAVAENHTDHVAAALSPEAKAEISEAVKEAELAMEGVTAELTKEVLNEMTAEYEILKKELDDANAKLDEAKKNAEVIHEQYKSLSKSKQKYILTTIGFVVGVIVGMMI